MRATTLAALCLRPFPLVIVLTAAMCLAPAPAQANDGGGRGMDGWAGMADQQMRGLMEQLKLTPEQRGKVETIRARHLEQGQPVREELKRKRKELFALLRAAKTTREQAVARQREVDALHARLSESRLAAWFEARAVLTPEQLALLERLPIGRPGKGGDGRGGRPKGRG